MSIEVSHFSGTTIMIRLTFRDYDGVLLNPDTKDALITDPEGADQTGTINWQKVSNGVHSFYYSIPEDGKEGTWNVRIMAVKGTWTDKTDKKFEVAA